jgi:hypothetical protein
MPYKFKSIATPSIETISDSKEYIVDAMESDIANAKEALKEIESARKELKKKADEIKAKIKEPREPEQIELMRYADDMHQGKHGDVASLFIVVTSPDFATYVRRHAFYSPEAWGKKNIAIGCACKRDEASKAREIDAIMSGIPNMAGKKGCASIQVTRNGLKLTIDGEELELGRGADDEGE